MAKDIWEKVEVGAKVAGVLVLGIFGALINNSIKSREIRAEYVGLAVGVLQEADTTASFTPLREYAVAILKEYSPVVMSDELSRGLVEGRYPLPIALLEPVPIMGIRGEVKMLGPPVAGEWVDLDTMPDSFRLQLDSLRREMLDSLRQRQ